MSNLYYKNINNKSPTNNHHMPRLFNFLNNKLHKSQENKRTKIMSELLLSNPDLLENFQRRYSKTPCRLRMKSSFSSKHNQNNLNSAKYTNLRIKMDRSLPNKRNYNWKQNKLKNNSNSISLLIPYLLIIGGFFCLCGYAASIHFIMCGILLDLIFIHNFFYYRDEKLKVNVLKLLSILGGAFFIV